MTVTPGNAGAQGPIRTRSGNISSGGMYFETDVPLLKPGTDMSFELTVPPGEGHFPYAGRVSGDAEILRVVRLPAGDRDPSRFGVGARFRHALKLLF